MGSFNRGEKVLIAVAIVLAIVAGVFAWTNFTRAFPEAHLTFAVNRSSSQPVAERFLREHAPAAAAVLGGRRHAAVFRVEDRAKVYLERELGLEALGQLTRERKVRLWSWAHRYFTPLDKEEVRVGVAPEGEVVSFAHLVPEEAPGATLDEGQARAIAEKFLATSFGLDGTTLTFIESRHEDRPHRRDWTFTFERAGWKASAATYRFQVEVHGDEPASYSEFLKIPDAWTQAYQRLRSANNTTALVAAFGIVLTLVAALIVLLGEARRGNVRWRVTFGLTAVAFALVFLLSVNDIPIAMYDFDTTGSYGAFLARQLLGGFASAGVQALLIFLVVGAGEPLFRARFGDHLRVSALFERVGWRSKRFALGLILGYCLAVIFLAYQVAFYLVGARFGAWNPAEVPFDNLLNTLFPWVAVLFMGFYPAVNEEFMSRVFSIPLFERLTHSRVAAVVVPALIWGFAHANYPAQPFYIRGVEVAVTGLAVGVILYRFGVLPCLVWHYVVDAGYTSMLLVRSGNPYFVVTALAGTGGLLVPLAITLAAAWRRGGFAEDPAALNAADPAPPDRPRTVVGTEVAIEAPARTRIVLIAAGLVIVGGVALWRAPDPSAALGVHQTPATVRRAAERFLQSRGVDPGSWRMVVSARGDVLGEGVRRYLLEHGGVDAVARFAGGVPAWQVRAFRPEEREEWQLAVEDRTVRVVRFTHVLREEAPGASLPVDAARAKAEAALRDAGIDPGALVFKQAATEKRPERVDHTFSWKDPRLSVADAEYLLEVTVQGDRVDGVARRFKLPEAWERSRERSTAGHYVLQAVRIAFLAVLVVHGILALFRGFRSGAVPVRPVAWLTAGAGALVAASAIVRLPLAWVDYQTSAPEALYRTTTLVVAAIGVIGGAVVFALSLAAVTACFPVAAAALSPRSRRAVVVPSILAAVAVIAGALALQGGKAAALGVWPTAFSDAPVDIPASLAASIPALAGLGGRVVLGAAMLFLLCMLLDLWRRQRRPWVRVLLAAGAIVALVPTGAERSGPELLGGLIFALVTAALTAALVRWALGANPVAWVVSVLALAVTAVAQPLLLQEAPWYLANGVALLLVATASCAWWLWRPAARAIG